MIKRGAVPMREEVLREQVRLAIGQIPMMQGASYVVAAVLTIVFWKSSGQSPALGWLGMVSVIAASRVALYFRFRHVSGGDSFDAEDWHGQYLRLVVISGFVWGASAFLLFPAGNAASQSLLVMIMTSLASATVASHTSVRLAPAGWVLPTLFAYSARCLWEGGGLGYAVGVLLPLYGFILVGYSFNIHRMMAASIEGRFENLELLGEVRQATRLKDKFVSLVSHDLRAPVAGMGSAAEYVHELLQKNPTDPNALSLTASVRESAGSLLGLLDQLLDISRLQTGRITPVKRMLYPRQLAEEKIGLFAQAAEQKSLTILNGLPREMRVIADPALYGQVISNLLANAVKFCNIGGRVRLYAPEGSVNTVAIEDTGVGIRPEMLPDLFKSEIKTTTFGTAGERGTGLGLPYCYEVMQAHGGMISVETEMKKGSVFRVSLPSFEHIILIVDDQEAHRRMMMEIIRSAFRAEFMEADDGKEALAVLDGVPPSLIVTDLNMPGMNGMEFIEQMRTRAALATVPVVIATSLDGLPGEVARVRATALGVVAFVRKPVVAQEFLANIRTALGRNR